MATKDTRRQFDEIVGHLAAEDPTLFTRPAHRPPSRAVLATLAAVGVLLWGGLSVLMVVWGAVGVMITCLTVALVAGAAHVAHRRHRD